MSKSPDTLIFLSCSWTNCGKADFVSKPPRGCEKEEDASTDSLTSNTDHNEDIGLEEMEHLIIEEKIALASKGTTYAVPPLLAAQANDDNESTLIHGLLAPPDPNGRHVSDIICNIVSGRSSKDVINLQERSAAMCSSAPGLASGTIRGSVKMVSVRNCETSTSMVHTEVDDRRNAIIKKYLTLTKKLKPNYPLMNSEHYK
ncbi:hypothetical protein ANO11243_092580 [Dothideomycetidae sp. 11243]|nr:hypothetical protein ANO11243_092580 [fungal sp. No.11243]